MVAKICFTFLAVIFCTLTAIAQPFHGVGGRKLEVIDPVGQRSMDTIAFFPSNDENGIISIGPYDVDISLTASIVPNRYPLILISHGNMGSMWGHHSLASFLAKQGYIVVTMTHPGDNFQDNRQIGATSTVYGRPMQVSAVLTAALEHSYLASFIDEKRIGFIGFSAGGTTGLILAGAQPEFERLVAYCSKRPDDGHVCEAQGHIRNDRPELNAMADPRIQSLVLLAPLSVVFPPETIKCITIPALIYVGEKDEELSLEDNAKALAREMISVTDFKVVTGAGHFTFLSPCSPRLSTELPALCIDQAGVDRILLHREINAEIANFFTITLNILAD